jgi:HEAT repeat protein
MPHLESNEGEMLRTGLRVDYAGAAAIRRRMTIKLLSLVAVPLAILVLAVGFWDLAAERSWQRVLATLSHPDLERSSLVVDRLNATGPEALIRSFSYVSEDRAGKLLLSNAIRALGDHDSERVVPLLIEALGDDREKTRVYSGMALAYLGADSLPAVLEMLESSPDVRTRTTAAWILSLMGPDTPSAIVALEAAQEDENKDVRYTATYSLHQLRTATSDIGKDSARPLWQPPSTPDD